MEAFKVASDRNVKQKCYFPGRIAVISATIKDLKDAVVVIHVIYIYFFFPPLMLLSDRLYQIWCPYLSN